MTEHEDLLDTKDGLLIAHAAWESGRSSGRQEVLDDWDGISRMKAENPYSQPLLKMIHEERSQND